MIDLSGAATALNKVRNVLGVRYSRGKAGCIVEVSRDTPKVREGVEKVMARYHVPYEIRLKQNSLEHIEVVERIADEAHARSGQRAGVDNKLPAHAHRARRGMAP